MKKVSVCLIAFSLVLLCGCSDYKELNRSSIAAGAAFDLTADNRILLTVEIIDFSGSQGGGQGESRLITTEGYSISEAMKNTFWESGRQLYFSHATTLIISDAFARHGIDGLLDYVVRNNDVRLTTFIVVSKLPSARDVFFLETYNTSVVSFAMRSMLEDDSTMSDILKVYSYEVVDAAEGYGKAPIIACVDSSSDGKLRLSGAAAFDYDKLIGYIGQESIMPLLIATGRFKGGYIDISVDDENSVSLFLANGRSEISPVTEDGNLRFEVSVYCDYELRSLNGKKNIFTMDEQETIREALERELEMRTLALISVFQNEIKSDCLGYGRLFMKSNPSVFRKTDWNELFLKTPVTVYAQVRDIGGSDGNLPLGM